eukprot:TRINITY_DN18886_c0_g2_i1.p1 TRINITY_DN18886_c0_g2~~TRINITY_DN18886_c0_g2_i1.p1  ORF type:complete len:707 (-),score=179.14 TRINITY_DN18886_c0_g2_i1:26-2146(-)
MLDSLIHSSPSQALVLAAAEDEKRHQLATYDSVGKRKGDWEPERVLKRGKRWGLSDDRPFRPLPYVDLPVGMGEDEVDQFLREQRLEDLQQKIRNNQLEDVEPDIRPPSPPPIYDRGGNRLNTREIRIRKAMMAEYNRLIRYMIKAMPGYEPPDGWKPQRLVKKMLIPLDRFPDAPFTGVIIGARGVNHKRLQEVTGCKIFIRGDGMGDKFQHDEDANMPMHVHIEADTEEQIISAEKLLEPLLDPRSAEFEYARTFGMQQVAQVNGFSIKAHENRCGICSAVGHLGFDCPEIGPLNYKMADVKCSICGDKGHVAADCKVAAEEHKRENVDWKEAAEKRQQMDEEYRAMMTELGMNPDDGPGAAAMEGAQAAVAMTTSSRPPVATKGSRPVGPPPSGSPSQLALPAAPSGASSSSRPPPRRAGLGYSASQPGPNAVSLRPLPPPPQGEDAQQPEQGQLQVAQPPAPPPPPPAPPPAPPRPKRPPLQPRHAPAARLPPDMSYSQPAYGSTQPPPQWSLQPPPVMQHLPPAMTVGLACPADLVEVLISSGDLAELGQDSGCHVTIGAPTSTGERPFVVQAPFEAMDRAKMHIQIWLDVRTGAGASFSAPSFGFGGGAPQLALTAGASPSIPAVGFPPGMCPPMGMPSGFPPGMASPPALLALPSPSGFCDSVAIPAGFPPGMVPSPAPLGGAGGGYAGPTVFNFDDEI